MLNFDARIISQDNSCYYTIRKSQCLECFILLWYSCKCILKNYLAAASYISSGWAVNWPLLVDFVYLDHEHQTVLVHPSLYLTTWFKIFHGMRHVNIWCSHFCRRWPGYRWLANRRGWNYVLPSGIWQHKFFLFVCKIFEVYLIFVYMIYTYVQLIVGLPLLHVVFLCRMVLISWSIRHLIHFCLLLSR